MFNEDGIPSSNINATFDQNGDDVQWIEFSLKAFGGLPVPTFYYNVGECQNIEENELFEEETSVIDDSSSDFVDDYESTLKFPVNHSIMEILKE